MRHIQQRIPNPLLRSQGRPFDLGARTSVPFRKGRLGDVVTDVVTAMWLQRLSAATCFMGLRLGPGLAGVEVSGGVALPAAARSSLRGSTTACVPPGTVDGVRLKRGVPSSK
jgi:hypothetical protein